MHSVLDIVIIFIFSAFILSIGLLFSRTGVNMKSFFAGGEAVPWFVGGLSLFMSFFSAGTFVAWGSIAYKYGWVSVTIQWTMAFAIYHVFYIGGNWTFVQRFTSVESPKATSKVAYLFAALYLISPVIWMLPPMIYKVINPSLQGLDAENAYLKICQLVLPPGLMGLMLTGMYFSTSATANTTLNVTAAVFTNDIYKNAINPNATEAKLMRVARLSSWGLGILMIIIALIVPRLGGMVEVVLTVAAVTAGPLLAPPVWALFSKRLSGYITIRITLVTLFINLFFKMILPVVNGFKLDRGAEMVVGMGIPVLLLLVNELIQVGRIKESKDFMRYCQLKTDRQQKIQELLIDKQEALLAKKQNQFGLKIIAFSLLVTSIILFVLSMLTTSGNITSAVVAVIILIVAIIPWLASRKVGKQIIEQTS